MGARWSAGDLNRSVGQLAPAVGPSYSQPTSPNGHGAGAVVPVVTVPSGDAGAGACFDGSRVYRYRLWRRWEPGGQTVAFLMLNPSTAGAHEDDPTVRRCVGFARRWGFGRVLVGNLFALRSPDPGRLRSHPDPVGPANDEHLRRIADEADRIVAAWGNGGALGGRAGEVVETLEAPLEALDTTEQGQPVHPLYQPADATPSTYDLPP